MSGETMRDRFAMAALTGLMSNARTSTMDTELMGRVAYKHADAALAARGGDAPQPASDAVKQQMHEALWEALRALSASPMQNGATAAAQMALNRGIMAAEQEQSA